MTKKDIERLSLVANDICITFVEDRKKGICTGCLILDLLDEYENLTSICMAKKGKKKVGKMKGKKR